MRKVNKGTLLIVSVLFVLVIAIIVFILIVRSNNEVEVDINYVNKIFELDLSNEAVIKECKNDQSEDEHGGSLTLRLELSDSELDSLIKKLEENYGEFDSSLKRIEENGIDQRVIDEFYEKTKNNVEEYFSLNIEDFSKIYQRLSTVRRDIKNASQPITNDLVVGIVKNDNSFNTVWMLYYEPK